MGILTHHIFGRLGTLSGHCESGSDNSALPVEQHSAPSKQRSVESLLNQTAFAGLLVFTFLLYARPNFCVSRSGFRRTGWKLFALELIRSHPLNRRMKRAAQSGLIRPNASP